MNIIQLQHKINKRLKRKIEKFGSNFFIHSLFSKELKCVLIVYKIMLSFQFKEHHEHKDSNGSC